jgi:hypothetical protein
VHPTGEQPISSTDTNCRAILACAATLPAMALPRMAAEFDPIFDAIEAHPQAWTDLEKAVMAASKRPFQKSSGNPTSMPGKARLSVPMTLDGSQQNAQVVISEAFVLICWTLGNDATLTAITHSGPPRRRWLRDGLRCGVRSKQLP